MDRIPSVLSRSIRVGCLAVVATLFGIGTAAGQGPIPELEPDLPEYDPGYPNTHLVESWDLGDLGYSWREDLGVEGNERIWFKWSHALATAVQGDWVLRENGGGAIASGSIFPTDPPPSETLWSVELGTLGSPTYPLTMEIEAIDGGGTAIIGGSSNLVFLNEFVPGPTTCFTDFGVGEPFTTKLAAIRNKFQLPALAAGIITAGSGSQFDAVGWRKLEHPLVAVTPTDKWHIGSNTKAMTATLVGLLQQKPAPLVQFSTTIGDIFPQSEHGTLAVHQATTIEMLLAHRSGIPGDGTIPQMVWDSLASTNGTVINQRRDFALDLLKLPPAFVPDTTFKYANAGYVIVASMLEEIYGKSWEQLMEEELIGAGKLGMLDAGHGPPPPLDNSDQPWGHRAISGVVPLARVKESYPFGMGPAGRIHTTLQDYGKFLRLLMNGSEGGVSLDPSTLAEITSPWPGTNYGYGWGIKEIAVGPDTKKTLGHSGSTGDWYLTALVHLDDGYALVAVTNVSRFWRADLNPWNGISVDEDGFFPHGPAAVSETLSMLSEHFLGCPSVGLSGGVFTTETGGGKEGSTLGFFPDILEQISARVPIASFWGGIALMAAIGAAGVRTVTLRRGQGGSRQP